MWVYNFILYVLHLLFLYNSFYMLVAVFPSLALSIAGFYEVYVFFVFGKKCIE